MDLINHQKTKLLFIKIRPFCNMLSYKIKKSLWGDAYVKGRLDYLKSIHAAPSKFFSVVSLVSI